MAPLLITSEINSVLAQSSKLIDKLPAIRGLWMNRYACTVNHDDNHHVHNMCIMMILNTNIIIMIHLLAGLTRP